MLGTLARIEDSDVIQQSTMVYLRDVYDHALQVSETLESQREILASMLDVYHSALSNRMNEVMKVLSIVSTIFIPLSFVAGVYGMNFEHMPELKHPYAYPAVLVCMAIAATESFSQRNQGCSVDEGLAAWLDIARLARDAGIRAQLTISTAFGCPFEGEVPAERVVRLAERAAAGIPDEIAVADTIGVAVPTQVSEVVAGLRRAIAATRLRAHFHNTRNTGLANAYAAVQAGVRALDASCGGIGGCPFAPAATGNIPTEDLIYMLHRMGFDTGVQLPALLDTSRWLQQTLEHAVPGMLVKAGIFPATAKQENP